MFNSLIAAYCPSKVCESEEKMPYSKLDSITDQCTHRDTFIVLDEITATTGTDRVSNELGSYYWY